MMLSELIAKVTALRDAASGVPNSLMGVANDVTSQMIAPNVVTSVSNKIGGVSVRVSSVEGTRVNPRVLSAFGHQIANKLVVEGSSVGKNFIKDNWS